MNCIVHFQTTAKNSCIVPALPKHIHLLEAADAEEVEELLKSKHEVLCIEAEKLDADLLNFLRYVHDAFFSVKVLVLLAEPRTTEVVKALEAGADECFGARCFPGLLRIKLRQLLQLQKLRTPQLLSAGEIRLAPHSGELWLNDIKYSMRRRESQILQCLLQYKNMVVSRELLLDHVWMGEDEIPADVTIDVYIRRIRMQLREHQHMLTTVRGFGYRLSVPVASS